MIVMIAMILKVIDLKSKIVIEDNLRD